jgi:hypothetical protein
MQINGSKLINFDSLGNDFLLLKTINFSKEEKSENSFYILYFIFKLKIAQNFYDESQEKMSL